MGDGIMADNGFDASRGELADEGGNDIIPEFHGGQSADGVEQHRGQIGNHAGNQHDDKAPAAAVLVEIRQRLVTADDFFCCFAEEEPQQNEAEGHADGLGYYGQKYSPADAENQSVGSGKDNGGRKAQRVDKEGQQKAEHHRAGTKRGNVAGSLLNIAPRQQAAHMRQEGRIQQMDDDKEQNNSSECAEFYHVQGFRI